MEKHLVLAITIVLCHFALSSATAGTAGYLAGPYKPSSCFGDQEMGTMIASASDAIWNSRAACGKSYRVKCTGATNNAMPNPCTGASVVVKIVEYCPPGCQRTIDLSREAFAVIADSKVSNIKIDYTPM